MNISKMGCTDVVTHRIDLFDDIPVMEKPHQIPPGCYDEVHKYLQELKDAGAIQESNSSTCHNLVFVKKKYAPVG